jgi:hypothetical protein
MVESTLGVYSFGLIFVSARTNKENHHHHQHARSGLPPALSNVCMRVDAGVVGKIRHNLCDVTSKSESAEKRASEWTFA